MIGPRFAPRIVVAAGVDLRREPVVPPEFYERDDWACGVRGCGCEATKIQAVPLGGQREFFGLCCPAHAERIRDQISEALESEAARAVEFDSQLDQLRRINAN